MVDFNLIEEIHVQFQIEISILAESKLE